MAPLPLQSERCKIWKYTLQPDQRQMLQMPKDSQPLSVVEQDNQLVMYVVVAPKAPLETRIFRVVTTGDEFEMAERRFIGTAILGGWFVAHVFECLATNHADPVDRRSAEDFAAIKHEMLR